MIKLFKKPKGSFLCLFQQRCLDFFIFLATCKKSKKYNTCISGEAVHSQMTRQRDDQTDTKTDILLNHHTTGRSNRPSRQ